MPGRFAIEPRRGAPSAAPDSTPYRPNAMRAVIFLGPTLSVTEARTVLDAIYLPPAQQADILSALGTYRPDVIGLVDGEFGQALSVWHKEILFALERGVPVFGASSMGALRAAETDAFGMTGVGWIYRMFASGELTDDDEVAVAHASSESGYRTLSEPLVNLRATFADARDSGLIDDALCKQLIEIGKALHFPERSFGRVLRLAERKGAPAGQIAALAAWIRENARDVKREDALAMLQAIRDLPWPVPPPRIREPLVRTAVFEALYQRDRRVRHNGADVSLAAISDYAALHLPDHGELTASALNRVLVRVLAATLDVQPDDDAIDEEVKRFRVRRGLSSAPDFESWLQRNDLEPDEFRELMRNLAETRALHRWLVARRPMQHITKELLDELRLRGRYEEVAKRAAAQAAILSERFPFLIDTFGEGPNTLELMVEHMRATPCRPDTAYAEWSQEVGFHRVEDLRLALLRARAVRQHLSGLADSEDEHSAPWLDAAEGRETVQ